jgi:hypothetical protein
LRELDVAASDTCFALADTLLGKADRTALDVARESDVGRVRTWVLHRAA